MKNSALVYSTAGKIQQEEEVCHPDTDKSKVNVRIWRQKIAGDRVITIIKGLAIPENEIHQLAKQIKSNCSAGGSVKNQEIIIQGDHRDKILTVLHQKGYKAKLSGG